jgi:hypothetical protein
MAAIRYANQIRAVDSFRYGLAERGGSEPVFVRRALGLIKPEKFHVE